MEPQNRIHRIPLTDKDRSSLKSATSEKVNNVTHSETLEGRIVQKPWGYEFLVYEGKEAAMWFLHIKKGHSTSLHCHPNKTTSLIVLSGKALCNTFRRRRFLSAGDAIIFSKSVFHSTKSLSEGGLLLLEIESPVDKGDLIRYEDRYGRAGRGYETAEAIDEKKLEQYGHFRMDESDPKSWRYSRKDKFTVCLERYSNNEVFNQEFVAQPGVIYGVCKGNVRFDSAVELVAGECEKSDYFSRCAHLSVTGDTTLMRVAVFGG